MCVRYFSGLYTLITLALLPFGSLAQANDLDIQLKRSEFRIPYKSDEFITPSYQNFEFILWRFGGYDIENDEDVIRFIALNDCTLFHRYMNYDLEWKNIQAMYRDFLKKNADVFPGRIRVKVPIGLKRYDEERQVFDVSEETQVQEVRILPVKRFDGSVTNSCRIKKSILDGYRDFIHDDIDVSLKFPLTLTEVPVAPDKAKGYIELVQREGNYESQVRGRVAYVFYDIVLYDYIRRTDLGGHLLYGNIERAQVYGNENETYLLYEFFPGQKYDTSNQGRKSALE